MPEPKEGQTAVMGDSEVVDNALDAYEAGTLGQPSGSSPEKETEGVETEESEGAVAEQPKTAEEKPEETEEETPEKEDDDPRTQMYRKAHNELKAKYDKEIAEIKSSLPSKETMEELRAVQSSPEYIQLKGKHDGLTQEAIDKRLRDAGHTVPERPVNDVELVIGKLGLDNKTLTEQDRAYITDQTKIARVMVEHILGNKLPATLKPLQEQVFSHERERQGAQLHEKMQSELAQDKGTDGRPILDYAKDIAPELSKWIDEEKAKNPDLTQDDVYKYFGELKHRLTVERLQGKKRKAARDEKKGNLRSETKTTPVDMTKLPKKTGNHSQDMDALMDFYKIS